MTNYTQYFEPLERAREEGRIEEALLLSQKALLDSAESGDPVLAINAYGHQLLIFKDQFTKTGAEFYLHLMHSVAGAGLQLAEDLSVSGQPVAVMHLRVGDYFFHYKKYAEAVSSFGLALQALGDIRKVKPGEHSEYLSHLGKAKVYAGDVDGGLEDLILATSLTSNPTELRDFHHLIVHSGNLARLATAYVHLGDKDKVTEIVSQIKPIAWELKEKYNMPIRWQQLQDQAEKLGLDLD